MISYPEKLILLILYFSLILFEAAFADTSVKDDAFLSPINRMFDDQHNSKNETTLQRLNRQAMEAAIKQDWKNAFGNLMDAMKEDPADSETYINFGIVHFMRKEYPSSEKALLKALEVDPTNSKANYHYSKVLVLKGEPENAVKAATQAVENSDPKDSKFCIWLGDLHANDTKYSEAAVCYNEALQLLKEKLELVSKGIEIEESKVVVVDTYIESQVVGEGLSNRVVEVEKFRTEQKEAPEEWHQFKASLEAQIEELESRKKETLKLANS